MAKAAQHESHWLNFLCDITSSLHYDNLRILLLLFTANKGSWEQRMSPPGSIITPPVGIATHSRGTWDTVASVQLQPNLVWKAYHFHQHVREGRSGAVGNVVLQLPLQTVVEASNYLMCMKSKLRQPRRRRRHHRCLVVLVLLGCSVKTDSLKFFRLLWASAASRWAEAP